MQGSALQYSTLTCSALLFETIDKTKHMIVDIVDDWRASVVGGFKTGLFLWESCCIPSLLYNAGSWLQLSKEAEKSLDDLQGWYLRMLLRQGQGVPSGAILWESAVLSMGRRVWREKLCLSLHISRLDEDTLAKKVWEEQKVYGWPGLVSEAEYIANELGVDRVEDTSSSKKVYRQEVTEACYKYDERMLRERMKDKKKCEKILSEGYGRKAYFDRLLPGQVRDHFSTHVKMLPIAGNFSRDRRFLRTGWLCLCGEREEQEHIMRHCKIYDDIRDKYGNMDNDDELVQFFRELLERRDNVRDEEEKRRKRRSEEE